MLDDASARELVSDPNIIWHQRFALSKNVEAPGANDIEWLLARLQFPERLDGLSVLDIGTTNGAAAFIAETRGASRVVATDILPSSQFGFAQLADRLASGVEFIQSSIYELPDLLNETFDIVLFLGVLYHLRHPLLGLDSVRRLTRGRLFLESAISGDAREQSTATFYRRGRIRWRRIKLVLSRPQLPSRLAAIRRVPATVLGRLAGAATL